MKIRDIMNKNVITCRPEDTIGSLAGIFKENHISGVPVVEKGKVVGIASETDLLKLFRMPEISNELLLPSPLEIIEIPIRNIIRLEEVKKALEDMKLKPVSSIMKKAVQTVSPEDDLEIASNKMVGHKVNRLPVIENGKLVGIITRSDIIKGLSKAE